MELWWWKVLDVGMGVRMAEVVALSRAHVVAMSNWIRWKKCSTFSPFINSPKKELLGSRKRIGRDSKHY